MGIRLSLRLPTVLPKEQPVREQVLLPVQPQGPLQQAPLELEPLREQVLLPVRMLWMRLLLQLLLHKQFR